MVTTTFQLERAGRQPRPARHLEPAGGHGEPAGQQPGQLAPGHHRGPGPARQDRPLRVPVPPGPHGDPGHRDQPDPVARPGEPDRATPTPTCRSRATSRSPSPSRATRRWASPTAWARGPSPRPRSSPSRALTSTPRSHLHPDRPAGRPAGRRLPPGLLPDVERRLRAVERPPDRQRRHPGLPADAPPVRRGHRQRPRRPVQPVQRDRHAGHRRRLQHGGPGRARRVWSPARWPGRRSSTPPRSPTRACPSPGPPRIRRWP